MVRICFIEEAVNGVLLYVVFEVRDGAELSRSVAFEQRWFIEPEAVQPPGRASRYGDTGVSDCSGFFLGNVSIPATEAWSFTAWWVCSVSAAPNAVGWARYPAISGESIPDDL